MSGGKPVCFVLPERGRSGGIRVTVDMANELLDAGFDVRIAVHTEQLISARGARQAARHLWSRLRGQHDDWLPQFRGAVAPFRHALDEVRFAPGEVVIAVGSRTVGYVDALGQDVVKVRYCHGFTGGDPALMEFAWGIPMCTIAVAPGLIPGLERYSGGTVAAVVPNGIHAADYFVEPGNLRDGVGTIFYQHPNKSPQDTLRALRILREKRPQVPAYVFGTNRPPPELTNYTRLPSVAEARAIYNRALVWFVNSRYEGFGLPMLEAMACGSAVVTTNHDGCEGLIEDGVNGFVVPFGDLELLTDRVVELLDDEGLRQRFVAAALDTARQFSWPNAVRRMQEFLEPWFASPPPRADSGRGGSSGPRSRSAADS